MPPLEQKVKKPAGASGPAGPAAAASPVVQMVARATAAASARPPPPPSSTRPAIVPKHSGKKVAPRFYNLKLAPELPSLPDPAGKAPATATFDVEGVDLCVVNAVRRAILADVRTVAIAFDPTNPSGKDASDITFHKNSSVLHNEFLGHRISMVPLGFDERQMATFDPVRYTFVLKAKNAGEGLLPVTTADFKVLDVDGAALRQAERDAIFPPSPVTGDHILLVRLKPSPMHDGNGEELHVQCKARFGSGRDHSRWSPVSTCFFRNRVDPAAFEASLAAKVEKLKPPPPPAQVGSLRRQHAALDGMREFVRNEHGEPCEFEFTLKTETRLRPAWIVQESVRVLIGKVKRLQDRVRQDAAAAAAAGKAQADREEQREQDEDDDGGWGDGEGEGEGDGEGKGKRQPAAIRTAAPDDGRVRVAALANMEDFYEITVQDEDHTLGNLVQGLLYRHWIREGGSELVSFIGYHQPHPLEGHIVFKLKCAKPGDDVRSRFTEGLDWVVRELTVVAEASQQLK